LANDLEDDRSLYDRVKDYSSTVSSELRPRIGFFGCLLVSWPIDQSFLDLPGVGNVERGFPVVRSTPWEFRPMSNTMRDQAQVVLLDAEGSRVYGVSSRGCYAAPVTRSNREAIVADLNKGSDPTLIVGKKCTLVTFDRVKQIKIFSDACWTIVVEARGFGDDILVNAQRADDQVRFFNAARVGRGTKLVEGARRASLMEVAGKTILYTILCAILTAGAFVAAVKTQSGERVEVKGIGVRASRERALVAVAGARGPAGVLAVGVPLTCVGAGSAYRRWRARGLVLLLRRNPECHTDGSDS
jgi:hypothetical protein